MEGKHHQIRRHHYQRQDVQEADLERYPEYENQDSDLGVQPEAEVKPERDKKSEEADSKGKVTIKCIVKSERQKRTETNNYSGDGVLTRLGVLSEIPKDPISGFKTFMESINPDIKNKYEPIQEGIHNYKEDNTDTIAEIVLIKYLYEIGKKATDDFYKTLIIFVRLYRECLNEYGWDCMNKQRKVTLDERKTEFAKQKNTADWIPDMCNDFINYYLPQEFPTFDKFLAIELVRHLCDWVTKSGYTKKAILLL